MTRSESPGQDVGCDGSTGLIPPALRGKVRPPQQRDGVPLDHYPDTVSPHRWSDRGSGKEVVCQHPGALSFCRPPRVVWRVWGGLSIPRPSPPMGGATGWPPPTDLAASPAPDLARVIHRHRGPSAPIQSRSETVHNCFGSDTPPPPLRIRTDPPGPLRLPTVISQPNN